MRLDLNKLLCERERHRSTNKHRPYRRMKKFQPHLDPDGDIHAKKQEGMRWRYGWDGKDFNENLSPLRGQIRKALGKRFDKFYSELCKVFDKRSVINQHILLHLDQELERKDVFVGKDGRLWVHHLYGSDVPIWKSGVEYFVDPRNGIIRRNKYYNRSR